MLGYVKIIVGSILENVVVSTYNYSILFFFINYIVMHIKDLEAKKPPTVKKPLEALE